MNVVRTSRLSPVGNGTQSSDDVNNPTSGQKWWFAVMIGLLFAIVSSPIAYSITNYATTSLGGRELIQSSGTNITGLVLHTIVFILLLRLILW